MTPPAKPARPEPAKNAAAPNGAGKNPPAKNGAGKAAAAPTPSPAAEPTKAGTPAKAGAPAKTAAKAVAPAKTAAKAVAPAATVPTPPPVAPIKKSAAASVRPPFRAGPADPLGGPLEAKFLEAQKELLRDERTQLLGQAESLEHEAAALMEDLDPGDVQFDDESGEGDTMVVERERDLALSAQARQLVTEIDAALTRIDAGTYGYSLLSGKAIPRDRLKAIPWATELVEEKVGGLGRR